MTKNIKIYIFLVCGFDPGSEWMLTTCLTHASLTIK